MAHIVNLLATQLAHGIRLEGGDFTYELRDDAGVIATQQATNDAQGFIHFSLEFLEAGTHRFNMIKLADEKCSTYPSEFVVDITITEHATEADEFTSLVNYPNGAPVFDSRCECTNIVFDELTFDAPGVYHYTMKETTPSGGGWTTDTKEVKLTITVVDDGHGNLLATLEYPEEYPVFINEYEAKPITIYLRACKIAIGGEMKDDQFDFGVFDEEGNLISEGTNKSLQ